MKKRPQWTLIAAVLLTAISAAQFKRVPLQAPAQPNPQLYKADANAAQEIRQALAAAGKQHKNVLAGFWRETGALTAMCSTMPSINPGSRLC